MKNKRIVIVFVLVGLVSLPFSIPAVAFIWEAVTFGIELNFRESEARNMEPEVALKIIEDARQFAVLQSKEKDHFDYRRNQFDTIALPDSIKRLKPRYIYGDKDRIVISLLFMMDTGGDLYVSKGKDGVWLLEGNFSERGPSFRIYPKL